MEKRDYLQDLIEKMAQFIRTLLQRLLKNEVQDLKAIEKISTYLQIDFPSLLLEDRETQLHKINAVPGLSLENQELLADLFRSLAEKSSGENSDSVLYYRKLALHLYQNIDQEGKLFSMERFQKIAALQQVP